MKVIEAIQVLAISPLLTDCRKLKGEEDVCGVRRGNYRIIYEVKDNKLIVLVVKTGHRRDIYKK